VVYIAVLMAKIIDPVPFIFAALVIRLFGWATDPFGLLPMAWRSRWIIPIAGVLTAIFAETALMVVRGGGPWGAFFPVTLVAGITQASIVYLVLGYRRGQSTPM
jgi:hypothetical protein